MENLLTKLSLISQSSTMDIVWINEFNAYFSGDGVEMYELWMWVQPGEQLSEKHFYVHEELQWLAQSIQDMSISSRAQFDAWESNLKRVLVGRLQVP